MKTRIFIINNNGQYDMNWWHFVEAPEDFELWFDQVYVPWHRQRAVKIYTNLGRTFANPAEPSDSELEVDEIVGVVEKISWRDDHSAVNGLCSYETFLGYDHPDKDNSCKGPQPPYTPGWQEKEKASEKR